MADIANFTRAKDWALLALLAGVLSLASMIMADNRSRIDKVEARVSERGPILEDHAARLVRLEEAMSANRSEINRRLERIEKKLDDLRP